MLLRDGTGRLESRLSMVSEMMKLNFFHNCWGFIDLCAKVEIILEDCNLWTKWTGGRRLEGPPGPLEGEDGRDGWQIDKIFGVRIWWIQKNNVILQVDSRQSTDHVEPRTFN